MKMEIDEKMNRILTKLDEFKEERKKCEASRQELEKLLATLNNIRINENDWNRIRSESEKKIEGLEVKFTKFKRNLSLQKRFGEYCDEIVKDFGVFKLDSAFDLK